MSQSTRRDFLKRSAGMAAAGTAAPYFWSSVQAQEPSKNDRPIMASIGVGGQGTGIGRRASAFADVVACCDVDRSHAERFAGLFGGKPEIYSDYRKLLDRKDVEVVTIGTPDHWHTAVSIAAMKAGKDLYCEKPLTLTIDEGKLLCKVLTETGRVFQVGTQQRSENNAMFLKAIVLARSGRLGKSLTATCSIGGAPTGGPFPTSDPPPELDWDFWLGQAPKVDYTRERCHGTFRWWYEYSGGKMTDWGAHHLDIAQWGLGYENSGPIAVEGEGRFPNLPDDFDPVAFFDGRVKLPNGYNTATQFKITHTYENGSKMIVQDGPDNGVWFEGDQGRIFVNRGRLTGEPVENLSDADKEWLDREVIKLYKGKQPGNHMKNFFECVKDRTQPISDVFTHHRTMTACHLSNIAILLKRKLRWDPVKQDFVGDDQASALRSRRQREPYTIKA
jgi:myo-inositol 2-dehydrogenase/D-chiro-inositol 1-dehydrogenase